MSPKHLFFLSFTVGCAYGLPTASNVSPRRGLYSSLIYATSNLLFFSFTVGSHPLLLIYHPSGVFVLSFPIYQDHQYSYSFFSHGLRLWLTHGFKRFAPPGLVFVINLCHLKSFILFFYRGFAPTAINIPPLWGFGSYP
jgi:hypothetical protein